MQSQSTPVRCASGTRRKRCRASSSPSPSPSPSGSFAGCVVFLPAAGGGLLPKQRRILARLVREHAGAAADGACELAEWRATQPDAVVSHVVACEGSPLAAAAAAAAPVAAAAAATAGVGGDGSPGSLADTVCALALVGDPQLVNMQGYENLARTHSTMHRPLSSDGATVSPPRPSEGVQAAARAALCNSPQLRLVRPEWISAAVHRSVRRPSAEFSFVGAVGGGAGGAADADAEVDPSSERPHTPPYSAPSLPCTPAGSEVLQRTQSTDAAAAAAAAAAVVAVVDDDDDDNDDDDDDDDETEVEADAAPPASLTFSTQAGTYACMLDVPPTETRSSPNAHITDLLEIRMRFCEARGDKDRKDAYQRAIGQITRLPARIGRPEDLEGIPRLGVSLKAKVREILETGTLSCAVNDPDAPTLELFNSVWGAGPAIVRRWFDAGFRTIEDLRSPRADALHTKWTRAGVLYFGDLLLKIPREEVKRIASIVRAHARAVDPDLLCVIAGSYRRRKRECGDVDILITHPKGGNVDGLLARILRPLHGDGGFLVHDLTTGYYLKEPKKSKYMGICRLHPGLPHRRIDVRVCPLKHWPTMLLAFTGSAYFNRSMRRFAHDECACTLSDECIVDFRRGVTLPVGSEQDVFRHLGLPYKPPHLRNHMS